MAEDERAAKQAISYLKEKKAGRTTFLPLDTLRHRTRTADEERAASEPGILGFASDVITYEEKYKTVFTSLLGKTLLADTMDTGSAVAKSTVIACASSASTGPSSRRRFSYRRQYAGPGRLPHQPPGLMEDLQQQIDDGQKELEALTTQGKSLRQTVTDGQAVLTRTESDLQKAQQEAAQAEWQGKPAR